MSILSRGVYILAVVLVASEAMVSASDVTKLAPEPVVIHLESGVGSEKIIFYKATAVSVQRVMVTSASGKASTIPEKDIQSRLEVAADPNLINVTIQVKTGQLIERGVPYKGALLIFTAADKAPEQVAFSIEDDTAVNIESLQAAIDVSVGPWLPERCQIPIRNNGKTTIAQISISSSNLTDAATNHRILVNNPGTDWGGTAIEPDGTRVVSFDLPRPPLAGTLIGQLYVTADQQKTISIPFTLRSRGPYGATILPFILFCAVLGIGFLISSVLDDWFSGGGLARAQAYLSLKDSQAVLVRRYTAIQDWKNHLPAHTPAIGLPRTEAWLQQAIQELGAELQSVDRVPQDQLTADSQRYALLVGTIALLWSAVQIAMNRWGAQPDQLQPLIEELDKVPLPSSGQDLNRYRDNLQAKFVVTLTKGEAPVQVDSVSKQWTPEEVKRRIVRMAWIYRTVVWAVVVMTAYQSYYAHNLAFGTLSDYLVLFTWALGLTQTGTQIVTRIHK